MEIIAAIIIFGIAAGILFRHFKGAISSKGSACSCNGCEGCEAEPKTSIPMLHKQLDKKEINEK